jgi:hypothetical protein
MTLPTPAEPRPQPGLSIEATRLATAWQAAALRDPQVGPLIGQRSPRFVFHHMADAATVLLGGDPPTAADRDRFAPLRQVAPGIGRVLSEVLADRTDDHEAFLDLLLRALSITDVG